MNLNDNAINEEPDCEEIIMDQIAEDKKEPSKCALVSSRQFTGIQNQGTTCHINAVLQVLARIKPFAAAIDSAAGSESIISNELSLIPHIIESPSQITPANTKNLTTLLGKEWKKTL